METREARADAYFSGTFERVVCEARGFQAGCKAQPPERAETPAHIHESRGTSSVARGVPLTTPHDSNVLCLYVRHARRDDHASRLFAIEKLNRVEKKRSRRRAALRHRPGHLAPSFSSEIGFTFETENLLRCTLRYTPRGRFYCLTSFFVGIVLVRFVFFVSDRATRQLGPARCPVGVNTCAPTETAVPGLEMESSIPPHEFTPLCAQRGFASSAPAGAYPPPPCFSLIQHLSLRSPVTDEKSYSRRSNLSGASSLRSRK
jgi:hypothetical protein